MSLPSVTDASYSAVIETLRGHISKGTQPSAYEMQQAIAVVKNAVDRIDSASATMTAVRSAIVVLDASACAAAGGATAAAIIVTQSAALQTAVTAAGDPGYTSSTVADG